MIDEARKRDFFPFGPLVFKLSKDGKNRRDS